MTGNVRSSKNSFTCFSAHMLLIMWYFTHSPLMRYHHSLWLRSSYCQVSFPRSACYNSSLVSIVAYHYPVSVVRLRLASDQQVSGNLLIGGRGEEENTLVYCLGGTAGVRLRPFPQCFMIKEAWTADSVFRLINVSFLNSTALSEHLRLCAALSRSPTVLADACRLEC